MSLPASVDLNADLGESFGAWTMGDDEAILGLVDSANIACGFHAGHIRRVWPELITAARHQQVREIERGRTDPDQHFTGAARRHGHVHQVDAGQIGRQRFDAKGVHGNFLCRSRDQNVSLAARRAAKVATLSPGLPP